MRPSQNRLPLRLVPARADRRRSRLAGEVAHQGDELVDLHLRPVELANQDCGDIHGIAGLAEALRRLDRRLVHHLQPCRDDSGGDDLAHAGAGRGVVGEAEKQRAHRGGLGEYAHRHLGDGTEQPLRPGHDAEHVVALGIELLAAEAQDLAIHQHHLDTEQVVGGEPVLEAVHAAGILGDVAADRAGNLAGGVRRIVEAVGTHRRADGEVGDARLDHGAAVGGVDLEDPVELAEAHGDPVGERQRPARKPGAGAARHDLDPPIVAERQHAADLARIARQDDDHGQCPVGAEAVALEGAQAALVVDDAVLGQQLAQRYDQGLPLADDARVGLRHRNHGSTFRGPAGALVVGRGGLSVRTRRPSMQAGAVPAGLQRSGAISPGAP